MKILANVAILSEMEKLNLFQMVYRLSPYHEINYKAAMSNLCFHKINPNHCKLEYTAKKSYRTIMLIIFIPLFFHYQTSNGVGRAQQIYHSSDARKSIGKALHCDATLHVSLG